MKTRNSMLRTFICQQYEATGLGTIASELATHLPKAEVADLFDSAIAPLVLPDLVELIEQVILGANDDASTRAFAGGLLTYVYNPIDLVPGDGVAGWIDDVVVASLGLSRLADTSRVALDDASRALCEIGSRPFKFMSDELQGGIEGFLTQIGEVGSNIVNIIPAS